MFACFRRVSWDGVGAKLCSTNVATGIVIHQSWTLLVRFAIQRCDITHQTMPLENPLRLSVRVVCAICAAIQIAAHTICDWNTLRSDNNPWGKGLEGIPSLSTGVWQGSRQAIPCAQAEEGLVPLQKLATLSQQHFALELFITTPCPKLDVANY